MKISSVLIQSHAPLRAMSHIAELCYFNGQHIVDDILEFSFERTIRMAIFSARKLLPDIFASYVSVRAKQLMGDVFGLKNLGVNLMRLLPNSISALD